MKTILSILLIVASFSLWGEEVMVENEIIQFYQPDKALTKAEDNVVFWEDKLLSDPGNAVYQQQLAHAYNEFFQLNGNIQYLKDAEHQMVKALGGNPLNRPAVLRSLAHNYISQHRFCEAMNALLEAAKSKRDLRLTQYMLYDVYAELGQDEAASDLLRTIKNPNNFHYLIRRAKWEDGRGNLPKAINYLNEAKRVALASGNKNHIGWIYSNLGDFYGHAGKLQQSKDYYQKALEVNPADWYSMKGLAWMAWSHDGNDELALEMLNRISEVNQSPSIALLKAEIYESQGKEKAAKDMVADVARQVSADDYGIMYNSFLMEQALKRGDYKEAFHRTNQEIQSRATPYSYAQLVRVYEKMGEETQARNIANTYVYGKTFEPGILLELLPVYSKDSEQFDYVLEELTGCAYELGPVKYEKVEFFL